jgi:hypothetical protein
MLAALGVALLLNVVTSLLPEDTYQRWKLLDSDLGGRLRWIYERIHFDPRPIDVVILGGSRAQLGLSAADIEQQLAGHGKHLNVVNFAIFGFGRNIQWVILNEIYKAKSPKLIVVEVEDPPYPFGHYLFKNVASADAVVSAPKWALRQYLNDLAYLPIRKLKLFGANLFPDLFGLSKQFDPEHYAKNLTDYSSSFTLDGQLVDMEHPVSRDILIKQISEQASRNLSEANEYARLKGGGNHLYIHKIADEAKAHGSQLIFDYIPMFNGSDTVGDLDFLKQYGPVINSGDLAPRDELFENWSHLNHAGARAASAKLVGAINDLDL